MMMSYLGTHGSLKRLRRLLLLLGPPDGLAVIWSPNVLSLLRAISYKVNAE